MTHDYAKESVDSLVRIVYSALDEACHKAAFAEFVARYIERAPLRAEPDGFGAPIPIADLVQGIGPRFWYDRGLESGKRETKSKDDVPLRGGILNAVRELHAFLTNDALVHPGIERAKARGAFYLIEQALDAAELALKDAPHPANVPIVDAALAAAQSESESWKAIDAYNVQLGSLSIDLQGPFYPESGKLHYVRILGYSARGDTRVEALAAAAEWCRAELAK